MYIHPFLAGVIATVLAELLIVVAIAVKGFISDRKEHEREESQDTNL